MARPINIRLAEAQLKLEAAEISLKKVQAKYDLAKSRYNYLVFSTITIEKIRALKKEKKLTYKELGARMGVSKQRVEQIFKSGSINERQISRIAAALDTTVEYLCNGKEHE